ncbi:protein vreteno [Drosophila innubila]|uniref:protein vreteno n=1 Tax=Drosophila innubila TaxID=198719 RepID=UPI00148E4408|nr:protein vreteno [Drosophila innubila]
MMSETKTDLSDWNPMADEFNDERFNKYDTINEAPSDDKSEDRNTKQVKYPYLVVKKEKQLITENVLRNFFGNSIIYDIEYRLKSCVYFVYFHNMCSIEAAWSKIRQFPNIIHCVQGRSNQNQTLLPSLPNDNVGNTEPEPAPAPTSIDSNPVDLDARKIQVSAKRNKHPEFFKAPIVIKADYTVNNSLLALNDEMLRYLNVRFEFALERHGAHILHETLDKDQAILHFRSGRIIVTPKMQLETQESDGDLMSVPAVTKCLACNCYTDNSCRFCKIPFCNPVCFEALSVAHKENCDKVSPPVLDDTTVPQFTKPKLPPSGATVKITSFEQSNVLYVRSAEIVAEVAYYKVLSDVMMQGKSSTKLTKLPQCGQIVIYKFDLQIVRAMVLNVDNPKAIYVVCVDFGSVEITTLENLYECNDYLTSLPRYAVPVMLRNVPRRYMCPNLREMMYELDHNYTFILKYSVREYDFQRGMQRVVLIESELNRSLNRLIQTILTPIQPSISEDGFKEDYLQHIHLPTGKNLDLVIMDNSFLKFGVVHCTILDFAYEITRMQRDIQHYAESSTCSFYAPPKNDLCIAQYQDKWCRGLCMELVGDGHPSILFIDYGNIVPVHVDNIRPYPPQFTFPILTTEYELIGLPADPSEELLARLEKHLAVSAIVNFDEVIYNKDENNYSLSIDSLME